MMRNRKVLVAGLAALFTLAACEAGPDADEAPGQETGREAGQEAGQEAPRTANEAAAGTDDATPEGIALAPIDHSGVTGVVRSDYDGDEATVTLSLDGLRAGGRYEAHVHDGRCATGGPVRAAFDAIATTDDGKGEARLSTTAAELPADAPLFVQVHGADGAAVACADLTRNPTRPSLMREPDDEAGG